MDKIIHFNSPEGPVWREKTVEDKLSEAIQQNRESDEYTKTHSNCCDAILIENGQRCSECGEGAISQYNSDKQHGKL